MASQNSTTVARNHGAHRLEAFDIDRRIAADFHLQPAITFLQVFLRPLRHRLGRLLGDRAIERDAFAESAAQGLAKRLARGTGFQIPAGHVERGLYIGLAQHVEIEQRRNAFALGGILADQDRRQFFDPGAGTGAEGFR